MTPDMMRIALAGWARAARLAAMACCWWVCCWMSLAVAVPAWASDARGAVLTLRDDASTVSVWPYVTVALSAEAPAEWATLSARPGAFEHPPDPAGNFGARPGPVWLKWTVQNLSTAPRWAVQVDYPMLRRIDIHVVRDGVEVARHTLGSAVPFDDRPLPTRAHTAMLDLPAGVTSEVYLRVESNTAVVVPLTLVREHALLRAAGSDHLLQGLLIGVALALLVYSLFNAMALRDPLFLQYAAMVASMTVFFCTFNGIGQAYLWTVPGPLVDKIGPLAMLMMQVAAAPFVSAALQLRQSHPLTHRALLGLSAVAGVCLVLSLSGVLDDRATQVLASSMGPLPLLLALPVAVARARAGDASARWLVLGGVAHLAGALYLLGLLSGLVPAGFWSQYGFQLATTLQMIIWVRVLGLRLLAVRRSAERAELERSTLLSMAETDALTGLPNRRGLERSLREALESCSNGKVVALYLLDLDDFKLVNDRWGHDAGDDLLVQAARRLRTLVRASDVVARLGGDEFVVVSPGMGGESAAKALGLKLLEAFDEPFVVRQQQCLVGATIGLALAPLDGLQAAELLKRADVSMHAGKQSGGRRLRRDFVAPSADVSTAAQN